MGSAFVGLADDATAAFTNPAGLIALTRPEISIEGRFRGVDTRFLSSGRISGTVLNVGEDRVAGPVYAEDSDSQFGASFVSFTYPAKRWALAGYRHELTRVDTSFLYRGVFERATFAGITDDRNRDIPLTGSRSIKIDNYGASIAFRATAAVTIGAGIIAQKFTLDAAFRRVGLTDLFGAPDLSQTGSTATQQGDDVGLGFSLGAQVQVAPTFRVGGVYRRGPEFEFTQVDVVPFRPTINQSGRFQVPDTIGVGFAWRPVDNVTIASDYVRVQHSSLKEDFINFQAVNTGLADRLEVDDANEFHVGVEYTFTNVKFVPALRGGVWYDPAHAVTYNSNGSGDQLDTRFRFILPGGEELWHYTFGLGLPFSQRFEFNAAADLTNRSRYASASAIIRF